MKLNRKHLRKIIISEIKRAQTGLLAESDRFYPTGENGMPLEGQIPLELWQISDWEDCMDTFRMDEIAISNFFNRFKTEQLFLKIQQLKQEIQEEMDSMDDPYSYDESVALKESLVSYIGKIVIARGDGHLLGY